LVVPTLLILGEREPLGVVSVRREATDVIPNARLHLLPTDHGALAWGACATAAPVVNFMR
jgi:hypothetical protein